MTIHDVKQGELDWFILRAAIPTASEFDNLVTPEFKPRFGETRHTYLCKKAAEWWQGGPLPQINTWSMDQGKILEQEAIPWFEWDQQCEVRRVGFITNDAHSAGCSPDGLIGEDCGIEIKCPFAETQVRYLVGGVVPKDYLAQVHGGMYVTGYPRWKFLSYRRGFPPLLVVVERDEAIIEKIHCAVTAFVQELFVIKQQLIARNGGILPAHLTRKPAQPTQPAKKLTTVPAGHDPDDLIP